MSWSVRIPSSKLALQSLFENLYRLILLMGLIDRFYRTKAAELFESCRYSVCVEFPPMWCMILPVVQRCKVLIWISKFPTVCVPWDRLASCPGYTPALCLMLLGLSSRPLVWPQSAYVLKDGWLTMWRFPETSYWLNFTIKSLNWETVNYHSYPVNTWITSTLASPI